MQSTRTPMQVLADGYAHPGRVVWIGLRIARHAGMTPVARAAIGLAGLEGDHRARPGKRAVTLIQWEHLGVIAALAGLEAVAPDLLRRNIAVAGFNLSGLRGREFRLGTAWLRGTGPCAPCSQMEAALGQGGYAAMRGHGGITAEVIAPGAVTLGDMLEPVEI